MEVAVKKKRLVYGVGINDADYNVQKFEMDHNARYANGKYKQRLVWICPFYSCWKHVLARCYSKKTHEKSPTYKTCIISEEWKLFSNFRKWMVEQEWKGMQIDKDVLFKGNKVYSAETCVFVTMQVNMFVLERDKARGDCPIGVSWDSQAGRYKAECKNPFTLKSENLGRYSCKWEAHAAWLAKKLEHAYALATLQTDPRVAAALIERYTNYQSDREKED